MGILEFRSDPDTWVKNRGNTLKALKRLCINSKNSNYDEIVKEKCRSYYSSTESTLESLDSFIKLQNIVVKQLCIKTQQSLDDVMRVLFDSAYSYVEKNNKYSDEQRGEIIVRIILLLVGEEDETLVRNLSKEWKTHLYKT